MVGERIGEIASGADVCVSRGSFRNRTIVGGGFNSFDDAFSSGFRDVHSVAPIVFRGNADVPSSGAMCCPGAAHAGGLKDKHFGAGRSKGCAIEIEGSVELGYGK